ncbi:hypothetical protein MPNT_60077 [Candidatus Methylacidithermus pantelleriae]|uniref:Uncharacterized protein n=1 Tax=Candidatus Methylacidithermus pantelleriae TaxID=2744239 RepID=A0A8J2BN03_9BACT|nr:hypothetical protein MPNT_60077 [Candidatus Methylacidithermus pantelleriae]
MILCPDRTGDEPQRGLVSTPPIQAWEVYPHTRRPLRFPFLAA